MKIRDICSYTTWVEDNQGSRCQVWTDCLSGQEGDSLLLLLSWAPSTVIRRCFPGVDGEGGGEESIFCWGKQMPAGPGWLMQLAMCFHFQETVPQTLLLILGRGVVKGELGPLNGSIFGWCSNSSNSLWLECSGITSGLGKDFPNLGNRFPKWPPAPEKIGLQKVSN